MKDTYDVQVITTSYDKKIDTLRPVVSLLLVILFMSISVHPANAATGINKTINFQGKLTNSNGTNVADSTYSVVFTLYNASSGGTNLWTETQSVTTSNGIFQVALGSVNSLAAVNFNSDTLYLGIKVGADSEMTPRIRFSAVPYAFNADKLNGVTATQSATGFTITGGSSTLKTLGVNNSLTFAGTDGTIITFQGTDTYVGKATTDILTNKTIGSTGLTFSGATTDITTATDENFVVAPNGSGDTIFTTDADTAFLIGSSVNTPAVLSLSGGIGNNAALIVNNINSGNLFVASASGATKFVVSNAGAITSANYTTNTGVLYTDSTGLFKQTGAGFDGDCLVMSGTTPDWGSCVTGGGSDLAQSTASLNNTTLAGTSTLIGTVSITPTTTTGDIWVQAYLWTNSLSNTNQTLTWELRSGTDCTGTLLASQTSALTSANSSDGPSGFLSYVITNPGTSQQTYAICGLSSNAGGASAGGVATATIIDNSGPQGPQGPAGYTPWQTTSLGVLAPYNPTTDLVLGATATASARFAVINVNSGTPIASLSAGLSGGLSLSAGGTITTTANQSLILGNSTSGHIILNPLGRMYVGIGTTAPLASLDVRGATGLNGGTAPIASIAGKTSFASLVVNNLGSGDLFTASSAGLSRFVIKQNGTVGIGTTNPTLAAGLQVTANYAVNSDLVEFGNAAAIAPTTTSSNALQIDWFVKPAAGNATSALRTNLTNSNTGAGGRALAQRIISTGPGTNINSDTVGLLIDGLLSASTGTTNQNALEIGTNWDSSIKGQGDLRINANGNIIFATSSATTKIGINTTTPLATLDIRGILDTIAAASISAKSNSFAALVVNNRGTGDILTASSGGQNRFVIKNNGNVGIGTTNPALTLQVTNSSAATSSAMIENTNNGATTFGLAVKLGYTGTGATTNHFIDFMNGNGVRVGSIRSTTTNGVSLAVGIADFAEYITKEDNEIYNYGDLICLNSNGKATRCTTTTGDVMGVMSDTYTVIGGNEETGIPVGLVGMVRTTVSNANGEIKPGDTIAVSDIPGVGIKATKAGRILGRAVEGYNSSIPSRILVVVQPGWFDPNLVLTNLDGLQFTKISSDSASPSYSLMDATNIAVSRVGAFAQAAVGNIQIGYGVAQNMTIDGYLNVKDNITAGILTVGDLTANSLTVTTENISIGGQTLRDYIASIVVDVLNKQSQTQQVNSTTAVSGLLTEQAGEALFKQLLAENVLGASISATIAQSPDVSDIASSSALTSDSNLALSSLNVDGLATISSTLRVKQNSLIEGMLTVIDTVMTKNLVVSGLATFFNDVVFTGSVSFNTPPTFSKDTAGFAIIKKDSDRVEVIFDKPYAKAPVVNVSISLDLSPTPDARNGSDTTTTDPNETISQKVLASSVNYIVTKRTTNGFTILLSKPADEDIPFSWTALVVNDPQTFESKPTISPTPTIQVLSPSPAGGNQEGEEVIDHAGAN